MTTAQADPRTEQIQQAADNVDHIYCDCAPYVLLCGKPVDPDEGECPNGYNCTEHPECPLCVMADNAHVCKEKECR